MSLYKGNVPIAGLAKNTIVNGFHIFDCKWADHLLEDISWLRADTFSWQSGSTYSTAYNELVSEYNNASSTIERDIISIGTPNYTVVGTPTINNGVVSNLTTSNYLKIPNSFSPSSNSWEYCFEFTTGNDITTEQSITADKQYYYGGSYSSRWGVFIFLKDSNVVIEANNGTTSTTTNPAFISHSTSISVNTKYKVRFVFNGTQYISYISINNGTETVINTTNSTTLITQSNEVPYVGAVYSGHISTIYAPFLGSIDLKECYIKINNEYWWQGYTDGIYITFKRTPKGYKIADATQETAILNKYNTDGIGWYYILDTANTQFKLPRTKFGFEGLRTSVGNDIAESLPNITGGFNLSSNPNGYFSGAFYSGISGESHEWNGYVTTTRPTMFNASRSSSAYQDNAPVQERATQMYLYFYVGEYAQTAIEQTAGINAELFNNKVDINLGNFPKPYLKTSYINGISGYNIWSNGYCEQWGETATGGTTATVNLLKTYNSSNYVVLLNDVVGGNNNAYASMVQYKYNNNFIIYRYSGTSGLPVNWKTCGYLAEGEY